MDDINFSWKTSNKTLSDDKSIIYYPTQLEYFYEIKPNDILNIIKKINKVYTNSIILGDAIGQLTTELFINKFINHAVCINKHYAATYNIKFNSELLGISDSIIAYTSAAIEKVSIAKYDLIIAILPKTENNLVYSDPDFKMHDMLFLNIMHVTSTKSTILIFGNEEQILYWVKNYNYQIVDAHETSTSDRMYQIKKISD